MKSDLAVRIQWLYGNEREVYRTGAIGATDPHCVRCGTTGYTQHGTRKAVTFAVRDRGSKWKGQGIYNIHLGCIPTRHAGEVSRIPARRRA